MVRQRDAAASSSRNIRTPVNHWSASAMKRKPELSNPSGEEAVKQWHQRRQFQKQLEEEREAIETANAASRPRYPQKAMMLEEGRRQHENHQQPQQQQRGGGSLQHFQRGANNLMGATPMAYPPQNPMAYPPQNRQQLATPSVDMMPSGIGDYYRGARGGEGGVGGSAANYAPYHPVSHHYRVPGGDAEVEDAFF